MFILVQKQSVPKTIVKTDNYDMFFFFHILNYCSHVVIRKRKEEKTKNE